MQMISEIENLRRREANYRPLTPIHFLLRSADVFPERVAVIDGARSFTWRQYADRCLRLASALRKRGIGKGRHRSRRVKSPSPRSPPSEISEGTAALSPEIFWRAFATRPPNVRYGTVLRAAPASDTKPDQPKFF